MISPKISIIVPTYNSAKTIERCIMSIINQTFNDWELIIIDNGSTDSTSNIVYSLSRNDARIILLTEWEKGVSNARNKGVNTAKGEYICFVDSDDWLDKNFLMILYGKNDADLVVCGYCVDYIDNHGKIIKTYKNCPNNTIWTNNLPKSSMVNTFELGFMHFCWNKLFKRSIISKNNLKFQPIVVNEDYIFVVQYLNHVNKIQIISDPIYHWVRVVNSTTSVNSIPTNLLLIYNKSQELTRDFFQNTTIADKIAYYSYDLILVYKYYGAYNNGDFSKNELYTKVKEFVSNKLVIEAYKAYRPLSKVDFILYWLVRLRLYRLHHFIYTKVLKIRN